MDSMLNSGSLCSNSFELPTEQLMLRYIYWIFSNTIWQEPGSFCKDLDARYKSALLWMIIPVPLKKALRIHRDWSSWIGKRILRLLSITTPSSCYSYSVGLARWRAPACRQPYPATAWQYHGGSPATLSVGRFTHDWEKVKVSPLVGT